MLKGLQVKPLNGEQSGSKSHNKKGGGTNEENNFGTGIIFLLLWSACRRSLLRLSDQADHPHHADADGTLDVQSRAWAAAVEKHLGQPVPVVNKPGATGMVGALAGAQAPPDGYTLTVASVNFTNAIEWELANGRKPPFHYDDFVYIGSFTMSPTLVIVPFESPYKTLQDLMNDAKAKPGQLAYCSGGLYGMSHLPIEIFAKATGLKFICSLSGRGALPSVGGGKTRRLCIPVSSDVSSPCTGQQIKDSRCGRSQKA
jgi:tripartite-type tricarboxylate transporter receptor subunit TctC